MKAPTNHRAIDPQRFRAQATGCSPCLGESAEEGAARAACVVAAMPPAAARAVAPAQGYPAKGATPPDYDKSSETEDD